LGEQLVQPVGEELRIHPHRRRGRRQNVPGAVGHHQLHAFVNRPAARQDVTTRIDESHHGASHFVAA
jgi:hypothetical protein